MKIDWRYQEQESTAILMQVCSTWWNAKMQPICPPCSSAEWGHSCAEKQPYAVSCHDQQRYYCISTYSAQLGRRLLLHEAKKADCCHPRLNPLLYRQVAEAEPKKKKKPKQPKTKTKQMGGNIPWLKGQSSRETRAHFIKIWDFRCLRSRPDRERAI